jgi:hypothetical protein
MNTAPQHQELAPENTLVADDRESAQKSGRIGYRVNPDGLITGFEQPARV